jgi:hypothetical protein
MKKLFIAALISIALSASSALAQPAPECPADAGAALEAACPCGADSQGASWKNHGKYVSCVVRFRNDLRKRGCLTAESQREIARCAARSTCGKEGATLCCVYDLTGVCSDTTPGDLVAAGTCSNDAERACDTNTDCITASGPKVSRRVETCTNHGGTPIGGGSVCSSCPIPPPAP